MLLATYFLPSGVATAGLDGAYGASDRRVCVLSTEGGAEAEAGSGSEAGAAGAAAGREASEGSAARDFREGPLEQLRLELQAAHVT